MKLFTVKLVAIKNSTSLLIFTFLPLIAFAQHSDIWLTLDNNQITISPTDLSNSQAVKVDQTTGRFLFTGDFSDLGQGPLGTDDPGYQTLSGTFDPGAILNYRAVGGLQFWNGSSWVNTVNGQESITYEDALGSQTVWTTSGVTQAEGPIDQVLGNGSIHSHLDFAIANIGGSPAVGAYMVDLELFATDSIGGSVVHTASDPVRIAFNFQLSASDFDAAIDALTVLQDEDEDIPFIPPWAIVALCMFLLSFGVKSANLKHRQAKATT